MSSLPRDIAIKRRMLQWKRRCMQPHVATARGCWGCCKGQPHEGERCCCNRRWSCNQMRDMLQQARGCQGCMLQWARYAEDVEGVATGDWTRVFNQMMVLQDVWGTVCGGCRGCCNGWLNEGIQPNDGVAICCNIGTTVNGATPNDGSYREYCNKVPWSFGKAWVLELLNGNPDRMRISLGVSVKVVQQLVDMLTQCCSFTRSHNGIYVKEQLAIFLYTVVTGLSSRHVGEHFQ